MRPALTSLGATLSLPRRGPGIPCRLLPAALAGLLALPLAAGAAAPLTLTERQVLTLQFSQRVQRLAVSDPEAVGLTASGGDVRLTGRRAGRLQLEVTFADGASAAFDVTVEPLRRSEPKPQAPDEIELEVGSERVVPASPGAQVLLEDNGVARALQDARGISVRGVAPGTASLVVVDPSGVRTTWKLRVR